MFGLTKKPTKLGVFSGGGEVRMSRPHFTIPIVIIFAILFCMGLANLYSASIGTQFFWAQLKNVPPAFLAFWLLGWIIPTRSLNSYAYVIYGIVCLMLIIVFFTGHIAGGSQRWLILGPIRIQPSELAKLATAIMVARYFFTSRLQTAYRIRDLWPLFVLIAFVFVLVFEQPDLGTAGICLLIATAQIAFLRIEIRSLMILVGSALSVGALGWFVLLHDYQRLRVINLFNPSFDPQGSGYNSLQSLIAIGSGTFFGKGFMQGTQTQLQFLPARHTDFIFAVFAEEHGFFAALLLFFLFGALTYIALEIGRQSRDSFSALLAVGLGVLLFLSFAINVSMVLGLFPVVGVPLPFFSSGGSSLLTICSTLGILVAIDRQNSKRAAGRIE